MLKKYAIVGLVMSLVGGLAFAHVYSDAKQRQEQVSTCISRTSSQHDSYFGRYKQLGNLTAEQKNQLTLDLAEYRKTRTPEQLFQEQQERLSADIDRLAAKQINPGPAADMLYGSGWQQKVSEHTRRKQFTEIMLTGTAVLTAIGAVIFTWCVLLGLARLIIKIVSVVFRVIVRLVRGAEPHAAESARSNNMEPCSPPTKLPRRGRISGRSKVLIASRWQKPDANTEAEQEADVSPQEQQYAAAGSGRRLRPLARVSANCSDENLEPRRAAAAALQEEAVVQDDLLPDCMTLPCDADETAVLTADALRTQAEHLQRQIVQVRQMAQDFQQATFDPANPINNALRELSQQIAAIREYAACQQNRVEKLQDGYDWNIVRTFCLRIIRCIDNIETRLAKMASRNIESAHLQEVRDELLFALESGGVEQFEPPINSDYRGQERFVEAVKEKVHCDDPQLSGKIAQVVRRGYHYLLNDDKSRVIRTAQVRLFGELPPRRAAEQTPRTRTTATRDFE